ncbi:MAG: four helix bundle protein [Gemmatimonadaceae bacterium]
MGQFNKLQVWRKAHALALNVYRTAVAMRSPNHASLRTQMIRAAMSIPANIVEGRSQASERDFCRFLRYALNSGSELEYHLTLARDIQAISLSDATSLLDQTIEVIKMLRGLIKSVSKTDNPDPANQLSRRRTATS